MKGYEQLEFEETRNLWPQNNFNESSLRCFDRNGNEIKIGDYVVGISSEAKRKCIEGLVVEISSDFECCSIKIANYEGEIREYHGNPFFYIVV